MVILTSVDHGDDGDREVDPHVVTAGESEQGHGRVGVPGTPPSCKERTEVAKSVTVPRKGWEGCNYFHLIPGIALFSHWQAAGRAVGGYRGEPAYVSVRHDVQYSLHPTTLEELCLYTDVI